MDPAVQTAIERWLNDPAICETDKAEIRELLDRRDTRELTDRFYRELEFGTGGIRGILGAGPNRMNLYTVGAAAQGLANYIVRQGESAMRAGVAIAYDCRRMSPEFARRVACVMAGNSITSHLFDALRPTPLLSFAVRRLKCTAGVMITASHNPPDYNGLKAYWSDGGQVVPPQDSAIIAEVRSVPSYQHVLALDEDEARAKGFIRRVGKELDGAFLELVDGSCLSPETCREFGKRLKIVFTPLHGTGGTLIPQALRRRGFEQVLEVPEQSKPDGAFPTVQSPNPEEAPALQMGIDLARRERADLVIASDPDADRVGIAVRDAEGAYRLMTGNQIAAVMTHYLCEQRKRLGRFPANGVVLTTIVSSDLMKEIARSYGADVVEVLTGFKWIADRVRRYEEAGAGGEPIKQYIFGAEESYGYMPCDFVRDKDAVTAAAIIAEAAAVAAKEGRTLLDVLNDLFRRFGYFQEGVKSVTLPGADGADKIKAIMASLRENPPRQLGGSDVIRVADYRTGEVRDAGTGRIVDRLDLPASDVIMLTLTDGTKVIARPSGTEPKIKYYILARDATPNLDAARAAATARTQRILDELLARF